MVAGLAGTLLSEFVLIILIFFVLYIIFKIGQALFGLILNVILGFVAFFILNNFFGLDIHPGIIGWIIVAVLGLLGAAIIVILNLIGITLQIILPNQHLLSLLSSSLRVLLAILLSSL